MSDPLRVCIWFKADTVPTPEVWDVIGPVADSSGGTLADFHLTPNGARCLYEIPVLVDIEFDGVPALLERVRDANPALIERYRVSKILASVSHELELEDTEPTQ